jgi:hypothetical protein
MRDIADLNQEQLYFKVRTGHFDGIQNKIDKMLTAYGGSLESSGLAKNSEQFAAMMQAYSDSVVKNMRLAAYTSSQFTSKMTPADQSLFDAQLAVGKAVRESNTKMTETYRKQGEDERERRDKEKQDADMKWYSWRSVIDAGAYSVKHFWYIGGAPGTLSSE